MSSQKCSPLASRAFTLVEVDLFLGRVPSACTSVHGTRALFARQRGANLSLSAHAADVKTRPTGRARRSLRTTSVPCSLRLASTRADALNSPSEPVRVVARTTGGGPRADEQAQAHARQASPPGRALRQPALEVGNALLEQQQRSRGGVVAGRLAGRVAVDRRSAAPGEVSSASSVRARGSGALRLRRRAPGARARRVRRTIGVVARRRRCAGHARGRSACSRRRTPRSTRA